MEAPRYTAFKASEDTIKGGWDILFQVDTHPNEWFCLLTGNGKVTNIWKPDEAEAYVKKLEGWFLGKPVDPLYEGSWPGTRYYGEEREV